MANEISVFHPTTGKTLTADVVQPDGSTRELGVTLTETSNLYIGSCATIESGDIIKVKEGSTYIASGVYVASVKLSSDGLDDVSVSEPSGSPSGWNFREWLRWLVGRFGNKCEKDSGSGVIKTFDSSDVQNGEQTYTTNNEDELVNKVTAP